MEIVWQIDYYMRNKAIPGVVVINCPSRALIDTSAGIKTTWYDGNGNVVDFDNDDFNFQYNLKTSSNKSIDILDTDTKVLEKYKINHILQKIMDSYDELGSCRIVTYVNPSNMNNRVSRSKDEDINRKRQLGEISTRKQKVHFNTNIEYFTLTFTSTNAYTVTTQKIKLFTGSQSTKNSNMSTYNNTPQAYLQYILGYFFFKVDEHLKKVGPIRNVNSLMLSEIEPHSFNVLRSQKIKLENKVKYTDLIVPNNISVVENSLFFIFFEKNKFTELNNGATTTRLEFKNHLNTSVFSCKQLRKNEVSTSLNLHQNYNSTNFPYKVSGDTVEEIVQEFLCTCIQQEETNLNILDFLIFQIYDVNTEIIDRVDELTMVLRIDGWTSTHELHAESDIKYSIFQMSFLMSNFTTNIKSAMSNIENSVVQILNNNEAELENANLLIGMSQTMSQPMEESEDDNESQTLFAEDNDSSADVFGDNSQTLLAEDNDNSADVFGDSSQTLLVEDDDNSADVFGDNSQTLLAEDNDNSADVFGDSSQTLLVEDNDNLADVFGDSSQTVPDFADIPSQELFQDYYLNSQSKIMKNIDVEGKILSIL